MEKETKKRKDGAEKERERKKKKLLLKRVNIQKAFTRASTSTESQTTVNSALLLEL